MAMLMFFGFLSNFSTVLKSCEKDQWPKYKFFSFFNFLTERHDLLLKAKGKVEYTWVPEIMMDD